MGHVECPRPRIRHATAGAGGYGPAWEREPELVRADWRAELVSDEKARRRYGVALDPSGFIDAAATEKLRAAMRRRAEKSAGERV